MILLFIFAVAVGAACHPECHWQCDDPVCFPICDIHCQPPVCEYQCMGNATCVGHTPACSVQCPSDMCEADACPACETVCAPPPLVCNICSPLCEATNCTWDCRKPHTCQYPRCELQCEDPACKRASAGTMVVNLLGVITLVFLISL